MHENVRPTCVSDVGCLRGGEVGIEVGSTTVEGRSGGCVCGGAVCWVGMASQYVTSFVVDKFMGGAVLKDVVAFCLSNDSLRVIEDFMMANACFFTKDEEHKLVYTEVFEKYQELVESLITEPLKRSKTSLDKFYEICIRLRGEVDGNVQTFIDLVVSVSDYTFFAEIMQSSEKRDYYFIILRGWQSSMKHAMEAAQQSPGMALKK